MAIYWRIQPHGLDIGGHLSEDSEGERSCLHVFLEPGQALFRTDTDRAGYGDEIVAIEAGDWFDNNDVEGVGVDPATARIVARFTFVELASKGWPTAWAAALEDADGSESTALYEMAWADTDELEADLRLEA